MKNLLFGNRCRYIRKTAETKNFYKKFFAAVFAVIRPRMLTKSDC